MNGLLRRICLGTTADSEVFAHSLIRVQRGAEAAFFNVYVKKSANLAKMLTSILTIRLLRGLDAFKTPARVRKTPFSGIKKAS
ncbi:MAG: hypothetical protein V4573_14440 [Pseudomonadota bacterium]